MAPGVLSSSENFGKSRIGLFPLKLWNITGLLLNKTEKSLENKDKRSLTTQQAHGKTWGKWRSWLWHSALQLCTSLKPILNFKKLDSALWVCSLLGDSWLIWSTKYHCILALMPKGFKVAAHMLQSLSKRQYLAELKVSPWSITTCLHIFWQVTRQDTIFLCITLCKSMDSKDIPDSKILDCSIRFSKQKQQEGPFWRQEEKFALALGEIS